VHGHHFQILEREDSEIDEGRPWKDTFLIGPTQTTRIAFVADNPGKWLLHCHMLEHAAAGMTTWFKVT
jgi:FtsP/CotA-like multicopper oxidase with cupredoxin domain